MIRPRATWLLFALCLAVAFSVMGWVSWTILRLERSEAQAARQSENERLALWRMDSAILPLIARESARPPAAYQAFFQAADVYSKLFTQIEAGEIQVVSPLLTFESPYIVLHFQFAPNGELTSPQVPISNMRDLAEVNYTTHERIERSAAELQKLKTIVSYDRLWSAVTSNPAPSTDAATHPPEPQNAPVANTLEQAYTDENARQQSQRSLNEFQRRFENTNQGQAPSNRGDSTRTFGANVEPMKAIWVDDSLFLARQVTLNQERFVQGCLLNWPAVETWLVDEIRDLLPQAAVAAVEQPQSGGHHRMLTSLPVKLVPGVVESEPMPWWSPMRLSLIVAWTCEILAGLAVATLLLAALRLSERRGAFVSAVTHELRTPLTTFRMYTEMLVNNMVPDEQKRRRYLETLRGEADRLGHLVENVLSYSRLDGTKAASVREDVSLADLLERLHGPLRQRAELVEMTIDVRCPSEPAIVVRVDIAAVERVLFNLIDNACKYAASAGDRRIHVECARNGRYAAIRVCDHGSGVARHDLKRLFRPFSKSASDAANSAPGVGLGLSLSRRLARNMGGDLQLDSKHPAGACFVLTLPLKG